MWNSKTWIDRINQQLLFIKNSHKIDIRYFVYGHYILYMCPRQCITLQGYVDNFHIFIIRITGLYTDINKMHIVRLKLLEIHCLRTLQILVTKKWLRWTWYILNTVAVLTKQCHYLPKISILASMFVCRFVCLSVCLFVCYRRDTGRTVWAINTKLGTNMEPVCGMSCVHFGVGDVTDDVIRSKSRSKF